MSEDKRDAATRAVDKLVKQGLVDKFQRYNIGQVIREEYESERQHPQAGAEGLVLVPREPTPEMELAGKHAIKGAADFERLQAIACYKAMLSASPPLAPTVEKK